MNDLGNESMRAAVGDGVHVSSSWIWFASSAFPMICGSLGPVASAFSICALVRPWRQYLAPGADIQSARFTNDPEWLTAINAVQLAIAITANLALLLNMARKLRFTIAQPLTIVGWYMSAVCLITLAATASGPLQLQPASEYVWSQAFYYGIYAAVLYFLVASLMTVTFLGAQFGCYEKNFMLTTSQRTLMLQTILFLMYLLIGALVFSTIEGWNYLDAVYWADVTLFTVGFGDYAANTTLGRALLFPYALVGVVSLGLVIGSIRSLMLDRGKNRIIAGIVENKRLRKLRRMARAGRDGILNPVHGARDDTLGGRDDTLGGSLAASSATSPANLAELQRRQEEFRLMRKIQRQAARRRRWLSLATSTSTWLILWLVGAKIFEICEKPYQGWSYFDAFYLCFVSLTTIGYGDMTPISNSGKSFFVFWSLLALPTMTVLISHAGDTVVRAIRDVTIQLGTITILPGDRGYKRELKAVLRMLSCGLLFEEDIIEDTPPGFLGTALRHDTDDEDEYDDDGDDDDDDAPSADLAGETGGSHMIDPAREENSAVLGAKEDANGRLEARAEQSRATGSNTSSRTRSRTPRRRQRRSADTADPPTQLAGKRSLSLARQTLGRQIPRDKAGYHLLLVEEIAEITQHIKEHPPRRYTYPEWVYYLRLVGEDEANAETHGRPTVAGKGRGSHRSGAEKDGNRNRAERAPSDGAPEPQNNGPDAQWSWVGDKSPLVDTRDEAEWILERLVRQLAAELKAATGTGSSAEA